MNVRRIGLSKDACHCGIQDFFDLIAKCLGFDPQAVRYDCTKINVSKPVQDQIFAFYEESGQSQGAIAQAWVFYGPKTCLQYNECIAEVLPVFIQEAKS